jgi:hypothetical protein
MENKVGGIILTKKINELRKEFLKNIKETNLLYKCGSEKSKLIEIIRKEKDGL